MTREKQKELSKGKTIQIHGKEYMPVAQRLILAQEDGMLQGTTTEVLNYAPVVVRVTITIDGKVYQGISSVDQAMARSIEKINPFEVAETSALGRALGFAGYGIIDSVASADEIVKSEAATPSSSNFDEVVKQCDVCGAAAIERSGVSKSGKPYHGIFCSSEDKSHTRWL